jgi:hypothetical protein
MGSSGRRQGTAEFISGKQGWDYLITVKTDMPMLYQENGKQRSPTREASCEGSEPRISRKAHPKAARP